MLLFPLQETSLGSLDWPRPPMPRVRKETEVGMGSRGTWGVSVTGMLAPWGRVQSSGLTKITSCSGPAWSWARGGASREACPVKGRAWVRGGTIGWAWLDGRQGLGRVGAAPCLLFCRHEPHNPACMQPHPRKAAHRSELVGMVGSMDTMASSVVSREMVVFL